MKRGLFGEKQNQVKIDQGGNAGAFHISAFLFRTFMIIGLYVCSYGSMSGGQTRACTTPRAVKETAEVTIRVPEITAYNRRTGSGRACNTHKLFLRDSTVE